MKRVQYNIKSRGDHAARLLARHLSRDLDAIQPTVYVYNTTGFHPFRTVIGLEEVRVLAASFILD